MNLRTKTVLVLAIFLGFITSCSDEAPKPKEKVLDVENIINTNFPNERSELAVLMRNLYNDIKAEKNLLQKGTKSDIDWKAKYGNLLEAEPTDSNNVGGAFEGFGKSFLIQLEGYQNSNSETQIATYNNMISSCASCHQEYCPGPLVIIKKLPIQ